MLKRLLALRVETNVAAALMAVILVIVFAPIGLAILGVIESRQGGGAYISNLDAKVRLHRRLIEEINLSALEKLPEHQRVPLVLFHFEDASYQDIADTLVEAFVRGGSDGGVDEIHIV